MDKTFLDLIETMDSFDIYDAFCECCEDESATDEEIMEVFVKLMNHFWETRESYEESYGSRIEEYMTAIADAERLPLAVEAGKASLELCLNVQASYDIDSAIKIITKMFHDPDSEHNGFGQTELPAEYAGRIKQAAEGDGSDFHELVYLGFMCQHASLPEQTIRGLAEKHLEKSDYHPNACCRVGLHYAGATKSDFVGSLDTFGLSSISWGFVDLPRAKELISIAMEKAKGDDFALRRIGQAKSTLDKMTS